MLPSFLPPDTHGPIEPLIFSSREHFTSSVALKAELKLSPITIFPPVMLETAFISMRPVWSRAQLY